MKPARLFIVAAHALSATPSPHAQGTWPDRPVRIVVPLPPGGPSDIVLRAAIDKMQPVLKQPLLVGHSLGGALSLAIALDHPDSAGALALIAPLTQAQDDVPEPFQGLDVTSPMIRKIVAWTLAIPMSIRNAPKLLKIVFGPDAVPADYPTRGGGLLGLRPKSFYNTSSDLVAASEDLPGMMKRYGGLTIPLGMLFAKGDLILDYRRQGEAMKQQCPALDLVLLDGHGHMLPLTAPDATADLIRRVAARQLAPLVAIA